MRKKLQFFCYFLGSRKKVFIMSLADIREDSYSGADDVSEIGHLVGFRYSGLKNCVLVAWGDVPYGQGYSYLGIVAFGAATYFVILGNQLYEPVFYDGLSVTACNAYHWDIILFAVIGGYLL